MAQPLENQPSISASDVKKRGWKAVATLAQQQGPLVVTNHNRPEVVVVDAARYQAMLDTLDAGDPLEALKRRFEQRLESLQDPAAGNALADAIDAGPEELARAANRAGRGTKSPKARDENSAE